jgi:integrase
MEHQMATNNVKMRLAEDSAKPTPRRFSFTVESLASLTIPTETNETWVWDTKVLGLGYRLRSGGKGAFYVYRRINGKPSKVRIGGREVPIEIARRQASIVNGQVASGVDPAEQKRKDRAAGATLGDLLDHFIETHSKPHKKSWQGDVDQVERYLSDWKSRQLSTIKRDDIRALHGRVGKENGRYAANRLLSLLRAAFNRPGDLWQGDNPAHGVEKFKEKSRDRFLSGDELPRFFKALVNEPNKIIRDYCLMLLLVGARKSNLAAMRWDEIDFDRAVWRIPETKNGSPLSVPLAPQAIQILHHREESSTSPWVFPTAGAKRSASGHIEQFSHKWKEILERAKIDNFRMHDLRRSLGSWLAINGSSLPIIGAILGHRNVATTAIYARLAMSPQRLAVNSATASMLENAPKGLLPGKVGGK